VLSVQHKKPHKKKKKKSMQAASEKEEHKAVKKSHVWPKLPRDAPWWEKVVSSFMQRKKRTPCFAWAFQTKTNTTTEEGKKKGRKKKCRADRQEVSKIGDTRRANAYLSRLGKKARGREGPTKEEGVETYRYWLLSGKKGHEQCAKGRGRATGKNKRREIKFSYDVKRTSMAERKK